MQFRDLQSQTYKIRFIKMLDGAGVQSNSTRISSPQRSIPERSLTGGLDPTEGSRLDQPFASLSPAISVHVGESQ